MKHILYRDAIAHSFTFAWKHKALWIFGLFAAFLGQLGLMPLFSSVGLTGQSYGGTEIMSYLGMFFGSIPFGGFSAFSSMAVTGAVWLLIMLIVVCLVIFGLAIVSQGAIIHAASKSLKLVRGLPSAQKSWHVGAAHFWKLFGLQVVKKALLLLCGAAVYYSTWRAVGSMEAAWSFTSAFAFVLAGIVGFIVSFLLTYAACYVVVDECSVVDAIEQAWQLFKAHWLVSIEVGMILLVCNLLLGLFAMFSFLVFFTPAFILLIISMVLGTKMIATVAAIISFTLFVLFIVLLGAFFTVFTTSAWTYLFTKMHAHGVHSKVLHWAGVSRD